MRAIVRREYGPPDVLQLEEVEKPAPKDNEVLIRIHATTVTAGDCEIRRFDVAPLFWLPLRLYMGLKKPRIRILGQELAGEIEATGRDVTRFKKDDQVLAATDMSLGAYAEYICLPEDGALALKPAGMTYEEAAALPVGGLNALYFLKRGNVRPGDKVLINGAGGSIGTFAVQIAKSFGAEVTAVDSTEKLDMLRSIGADHVIDYTQEDFTRNGETYDVILDVIGKNSFSRSSGSLTQHGRFLAANPNVSAMVREKWTSWTGGKKLFTGMADYTPDGFASLTELIESGKAQSVIDRRYPLEQMAEAHRYVETGRKAGSVVITVVPQDAPQ